MTTGSRGVRGGAIITVAQGLRLGVQFLSLVLLSRLLSPADFGLVAMVSVVLSLGDLLRDFGIPTAALQARELSQQQSSNLFWINFGMGLASALGVVVLTPLLVLVYGRSELAAITPVLAVGLAMNGLQTQWLVHLARAGRFGAIAISDVIAPLLGLALALVIAANGGGYWALVGQSLVTTATLTISRAALARWLPGRPRRHSGTGPILRSGLRIGGAQFLGYAASNADSFIIGVQFGPTQLGVYNRGFQLMSLPISGLLGPLTNVVLPTVRQAASEGQNFFEIMRRIQFLGALPLVAILSTLVVTAPSLLPALLGNQWDGVVPIFQVLAIGTMFQCLSYVSYWTFLLQHKERQLLHYNLLTKPVAILLVLGGSLFGPVGVAVGYALSLVIAWPVSLAWLRKVAGQPFLEFFMSGLHILGAGGISVAIGFGISSWTGAHVEGVPHVLLVAGSCLATFALSTVALPSARRELARSLPLLRSAFGRNRKTE